MLTVTVVAFATEAKHRRTAANTSFLNDIHFLLHILESICKKAKCVPFIKINNLHHVGMWIEILVLKILTMKKALKRDFQAKTLPSRKRHVSVRRIALRYVEIRTQAIVVNNSGDKKIFPCRYVAKDIVMAAPCFITVKSLRFRQPVPFPVTDAIR